MNKIVIIFLDYYMKIIENIAKKNKIGLWIKKSSINNPYYWIKNYTILEIFAPKIRNR